MTYKLQHYIIAPGTLLLYIAITSADVFPFKFLPMKITEEVSLYKYLFLTCSCKECYFVAIYLLMFSFTTVRCLLTVWDDL